jgi:hypothetical protein
MDDLLRSFICPLPSGEEGFIADEDCERVTALLTVSELSGSTREPTRRFRAY